MIILHVKQTFINRDERDSYYAALCTSGVPAASRAEDGNIMYDYFFSADRGNEMLLIEKWENDEALTHHQNTAHFKQLPSIKAPYTIESKIDRYEV